MGRWAQQRRRGGSEPQSGQGAQIDNIILTTANTIDINFFDPIVANTTASPGNSVRVNGLPIASVDSVGAFVVSCTLAAPAVNGDTFDVLAQPPWLTTPITFPVHAAVQI